MSKNSRIRDSLWVVTERSTSNIERPTSEIEELIIESDELICIFVASIKTAKKRL